MNDRCRTYRTAGALLMLFCIVSGAIAQPLALEKERPQKGWQIVLPKDSSYQYYGLPQGILCVSLREVMLLDPRNGRSKWKAEVPKLRSGVSAFVKFIAEEGSTIVVDIEVRDRGWRDMLLVIDARTGRRLSQIDNTGRYVSGALAVQGSRVLLHCWEATLVYGIDGRLLETKQPPLAFRTSQYGTTAGEAIPWGDATVVSFRYEDFAMDLGDLAGLVGVALKVHGSEDLWKGALTRRALKVDGLRTLKGDKATETYYPAIAVEGDGVWVVRASERQSQLVRVLRSGAIDPKAPQPEIEGKAWTDAGILFWNKGSLRLLKNGRIRQIGKLPDLADSFAHVTRWGVLRDGIRSTSSGKAQFVLRLDPIGR